MSQTVTAARPDAVELLIADHRTVEQLFQQLELASKTSAVENQRDLAQRLVRDLSVHAAAEEQVLYPTLRRSLDEGDRLADEGVAEHAELKQLLADLDSAQPGDDRFFPGFRRVMEIVRAHVAEEEATVLPRLRQALGQDALYELAEALFNAKRLAPTRPHPHAPTRPSANIVVGAATSFTDRTRDVIRDTPMFRSR
ncbi:MAG: hemerythrin domain-containing protein [Actinobacteria bacterium]|nr:hemerythrin domain-containing protein [Actinomycetota bacterium]